MIREELLYTNKTMNGIESDVSKYLWEIFLLFVAISSLIGNTTILIASIKYKAIKIHKVIVTIIQHIAVCDLMVVLTNVLPKLISVITDERVFGHLGCKILLYLRVFFDLASRILLCAMTTSKMFHIKYPFRFVTITIKKTHYICLTCWLGTVVPPVSLKLMFDDNIIFSNTSYECIFQNAMGKFRLLAPMAVGVVMFSPTCVIIATSSYVLVKAMKSARRVRGNLKWQGALATLATAFCNVLSTAPLVIYQILVAIFSTRYKSNTLFIHFYRVAESSLFINTICNFYIYCLTVTSFREYISAVICRCSPSIGNDQSSHKNCK